MKPIRLPMSVLHPRAAASALAALLAFTALRASPATAPLLLDDYSDPGKNRLGVERMLVNDKTVGSASTATVKCGNGVLAVTGDLVPGRGAPAFISQVSLLNPGGKAKDLTGFTGVRLKVKVTKGILCVQVASTEVTNFDYHTSTPIAGGRGGFQEVRIPFKDLKRAWSEQTALNAKTVTSVNLVSFGMTPDSFAYEVDEIGFY